MCVWCRWNSWWVREKIVLWCMVSGESTKANQRQKKREIDATNWCLGRGGEFRQNWMNHNILADHWILKILENRAPMEHYPLHQSQHLQLLSDAILMLLLDQTLTQLRKHHFRLMVCLHGFCCLIVLLETILCSHTWQNEVKRVLGHRWVYTKQRIVQQLDLNEKWLHL